MTTKTYREKLVFTQTPMQTSLTLAPGFPIGPGGPGSPLSP